MYDVCVALRENISEECQIVDNANIDVYSKTLSLLLLIK